MAQKQPQSKARSVLKSPLWAMAEALSKGSPTAQTRGQPVKRSADAGSSKESLSKIVTALALDSRVGAAPAKNPWGVVARAT